MAWRDARHMIKFLPLVLLPIALVVGGVREFHHAGKRDQSASEIARLSQSLEDSQAHAVQLEAEIATIQGALAASKQGSMNRDDRIQNLETQRDHLRSELERRKAAEIAANEAQQQLTQQLEQRGLELLQAQSEPRALRLQIDALQRELSRHEARLLNLSERLHHSPQLSTFVAKSTNGHALAIAGESFGAHELPRRVLLARKNQLLGAATLTRKEGKLYVGRIEPDFLVSSALVKGEKLIMFPIESHEAIHP